MWVQILKIDLNDIFFDLNSMTLILKCFIDITKKKQIHSNNTQAHQNIQM